MRLRRTLIAGAAVALAVGTAVAIAPSASALGAPIVWYQAVAVPSSTSPCPVTSDAEKAAGWSNWTNSWAEWPNGGKGGNVCTRSITWAHQADASTGGPTSGCLSVGKWLGAPYYDFWGLFTDSHISSSAPTYLDAACTSTYSSWGVNLVYASSEGSAQAICDTFDPGSDATPPTWFLNPYNPSVWACD